MLQRDGIRLSLPLPLFPPFSLERALLSQPLLHVLVADNDNERAWAWAWAWAWMGVEWVRTEARGK